MEESKIDETSKPKAKVSMPIIEAVSSAIKYKVTGLLLKDFLDKDFVKKIENKFKGIESVFMVFVINENDKKTSYPLVLSHQNNDEIEKRILNVECPNTKNLNAFIDILKNK